MMVSVARRTSHFNAIAAIIAITIFVVDVTLISRLLPM
jgi:hypothetical protein